MKRLVLCLSLLCGCHSIQVVNDKQSFVSIGEPQTTWNHAFFLGFVSVPGTYSGQELCFEPETSWQGITTVRGPLAVGIKYGLSLLPQFIASAYPGKLAAVADLFWDPLNVVWTCGKVR